MADPRHAGPPLLNQRGVYSFHAFVYAAGGAVEVEEGSGETLTVRPAPNPPFAPHLASPLLR